MVMHKYNLLLCWLHCITWIIFMKNSRNQKLELSRRKGNLQMWQLTFPSIIYHEVSKLEKLLVSCWFFASSIKFLQCHKTCISPPLATCNRNTRGTVANHEDMILTNTKMKYIPRRRHFKTFSCQVQIHEKK